MPVPSVFYVETRYGMVLPCHWLKAPRACYGVAWYGMLTVFLLRGLYLETGAVYRFLQQEYPYVGRLGAPPPAISDLQPEAENDDINDRCAAKFFGSPHFTRPSAWTPYMHEYLHLWHLVGRRRNLICCQRSSMARPRLALAPRSSLPLLKLSCACLGSL